MQNQKRENLLNLALSATDEERERSENLDVGYDPEERTWELIVRHSGSLAGLHHWRKHQTTQYFQRLCALDLATAGVKRGANTVDNISIADHCTNTLWPK